MQSWFARVVLAAVIGGIAGCTGSSPTPHPASHGGRPKPPPHHTVPVVGLFEAVGGPAAATPSPLRGRVTFLGLASRGFGETPTRVTVSVGPDGRFRAWLRPDSYDVFGRSAQFNNGHVRCLLNPHRPMPFFGTTVHHVKLYCQRK
jgi:hypothetical protein